MFTVMKKMVPVVACVAQLIDLSKHFGTETYLIDQSLVSSKHD